MNPEGIMTTKEATRLLAELNFAEYCLEALACGDPGGPMTSSVTQRRNVARRFASLGERLSALGEAVDPTWDPIPGTMGNPVNKKASDGQDTTSNPPEAAPISR